MAQLRLDEDIARDLCKVCLTHAQGWMRDALAADVEDDDERAHCVGRARAWVEAGVVIMAHRGGRALSEELARLRLVDPDLHQTRAPERTDAHASHYTTLRDWERAMAATGGRRSPDEHGPDVPGAS